MKELFYDRNPGDARVKVGSERKFVTSDTVARPRQTSVSSRSVVFFGDSARRDPQNLAYLQGSLSPKISPEVTEIWPPKSWYCFVGIYFPIEICDPDLYIPVVEFTKILSWARLKVFLWAHKSALEPSPGLPRLRDTPHSGASPETPCFVSHLPSNASKVLAIFLKASGSCGNS